MTFQRKVTLVLIVVNMTLTCALAGLTYPRLFNEQFEWLRTKVRSTAATGILSIDGDLHQTLPADPSAIALPAYRKLQTQLRKILGANPGTRYVWTMVKSEKSGETIFVGDVGGARSKPGLRYDASVAPQLLAGFDGPTADRSPVKDPWGISISGYAPIRNQAGQVVAVLGVDVYGKELYIFRRRFERLLILSLALGLLLAILLGGVVARWIAKPLASLIHGMRRVETGALTHEVTLTTGDEFQEAAAAFNRMTAGLRAARDELRESFIKTVQSLMHALEAKDPYSRGHSVSVTRYATQIAQALGKSDREIETLNRLTMLHDIGKIGIHDAVLLKPGSFTEEERRSMQEHPSIGGKILAPLGLSSEELALILGHHEREDGSGYPQGLDRSQISDLVAIVSVADAYDAMTSHRPYRHAMKPEEALKELRRVAGTQFRPEAVEALALIVSRLHKDATT